MIVSTIIFCGKNELNLILKMNIIFNILIVPIKWMLKMKLTRQTSIS